jgi:Effector Associated Constant Component 1
MTIMVLDDPDETDPLPGWLDADEDLRGQAEVRASATTPGTLGPPPELVELILQRGGALTVAVHVVLLWLRTRRGTVSLEIKKGKSTAKLSAQQVKGLDPQQLAALADKVANALDEQ